MLVYGQEWSARELYPCKPTSLIVSIILAMGFVGRSFPPVTLAMPPAPAPAAEDAVALAFLLAADKRVSPG